MAHPIRIEIIEIPGDREVAFTGLQTETSVLKSNLSQHLSLMLSNGLLMQRREGFNAYYKLSSNSLRAELSTMSQFTQWTVESDKLITF